MQSVKSIAPLRMYFPPYEVISTAKISANDPSLQPEIITNAKDTDTYPSHRMTGVNSLRAENHTGNGLKIAIVDTGVDYTRPALGGSFGANCKIAFGYDLL